MGKRGFLRREASPKEVLEHGLRLAREVAPPTPKGQRGRPWRYDHGLYLALLLLRAFFHLPYRKTAALLQDLMEAPFPSHPSLARYAVQHLDLKLLEALLERLSRELEAHLSSRDSPEEDPAPPLYPMDTTGLAYRREDRFLRFRRGAEVRRVRGHARLLALVRWERERRWLLPWGGVAGRGYAPDPRLGGKARMEARVRAREGWDPEVYRFRGVVEGVFGGMKTGLGGAYLWERKPWTAMARAFLELIAYGLRVLLSLLPPLPSSAAPWVQGDLLGKPSRLDRYAAFGVKQEHDPAGSPLWGPLPPNEPHLSGPGLDPPEGPWENPWHKEAA